MTRDSRKMVFMYLCYLALLSAFSYLIKIKVL